MPKKKKQTIETTKHYIIYENKKGGFDKIELFINTKELNDIDVDEYINDFMDEINEVYDMTVMTDDNYQLRRYIDKDDPFYKVYKNKKRWNTYLIKTFFFT